MATLAKSLDDSLALAPPLFVHMPEGSGAVAAATQEEQQRLDHFLLAEQENPAVAAEVSTYIAKHFLDGLQAEPRTKRKSSLQAMIKNKPADFQRIACTFVMLNSAQRAQTQMAQQIKDAKDALDDRIRSTAPPKPQPQPQRPQIKTALDKFNAACKKNPQAANALKQVLKNSYRDQKLDWNHALTQFFMTPETESLALQLHGLSNNGADTEFMKRALGVNDGPVQLGTWPQEPAGPTHPHPMTLAIPEHKAPVARPTKPASPEVKPSMMEDRRRLLALAKFGQAAQQYHRRATEQRLKMYAQFKISNEEVDRFIAAHPFAMKRAMQARLEDPLSTNIPFEEDVSPRMKLAAELHLDLYHALIMFNDATARLKKASEEFKAKGYPPLDPSIPEQRDIQKAWADMGDYVRSLMEE